MARREARILALALPFLPLSALGAVPPRPAPAVYATPNYGLTFRSPPNTIYCPLARDWIGSDHGTVLFLENPGNCGDGGYPSSSRSFERNAARITLYYGYVAMDDPPPLPRCPGTPVRFIGNLRPICLVWERGTVRASLVTRYVSDRHMEREGVPSEATLTLVTRPRRLLSDLAVFRRLAATLRTCSSVWPRLNGHRSFVVGVGPRCPHVGTF